MSIATCDWSSVRVLEVYTFEVDVYISDPVVMLCIQICLLDTNESDTSLAREVDFLITAVVVLICSPATRSMKNVSYFPA